MYWIKNKSNDPAFNLALEEYFLRKIVPGHPGYALLWQNRPTVVVGRFQNTRQEVNTDFVRRNGIDVVRRMSGGGAVYHDLGTLNYTFIHHLNAEGMIPSFSEAGKPVAEALQSLGFPVTFSGRNDLMLHEHKIAGVAHCRQGMRYLHHGCILVNSDLDMLSQVLHVDPEKYLSKGVGSVRSRVGNLAEVKHTTVEAIQQAILAHRSGEILTLDESDLNAILVLCDEKYRSWDWTYGASPPFTERKAHRFPWGRIEVLYGVKHGEIETCRIHGDFFTPGHSDMEIGDLEQALTGIPYTSEAIMNALSTFPVENVLKDCNPLELKTFLAE